MTRTRKIKVRLHPCGDSLRREDTQPETITATFVNPGEWFNKRWLIGVGAGFSCIFYVVEADHEQDAIDALVDSEWGHILKTEDRCGVCIKQGIGSHEGYEGCQCSFAGNYSERVDLDDIRVLERIGKW